MVLCAITPTIDIRHQIHCTLKLNEEDGVFFNYLSIPKSQLLFRIYSRTIAVKIMTLETATKTPEVSNNITFIAETDTTPPSLSLGVMSIKNIDKGAHKRAKRIQEKNTPFRKKYSNTAKGRLMTSGSRKNAKPTQ